MSVRKEVSASPFERKERRARQFGDCAYPPRREYARSRAAVDCMPHKAATGIPSRSSDAVCCATSVRSGETTIVRPGGPLPLLTIVGNWKMRDLPALVGRTARMSRPWSAALMSCSWCGRISLHRKVPVSFVRSSADHGCTSVSSLKSDSVVGCRQKANSGSASSDSLICDHWSSSKDSSWQRASSSVPPS